MQDQGLSDDLGYHPVGADADQIIDDGQFRKLLLVGYDLPATFDSVDESRYLSEPEVPLPTGVYEFELNDGRYVMVVTEGAPPGQPAHERWDAADDAPLIQAFGWFSSWWDRAESVPVPMHNVKDDAITVPSGQDAVVRDRQFNDGHWSYKIRVDGRLTTVLESGLASPSRDDDPREWVSRSPAPVSRFASTLTRVKLREQLTDTVYSFRATRTIFRPYQFRPVIKLLETGRLRLLIADEVGLGKTIEAGLIWTELDARSQASRVLVVCPSGLVAKWRAEMQERFGFDMDELTSDSLSEMLERLESDRLPSRFHAVCSLERLRIWGGLERMAELAPRF